MWIFITVNYCSKILRALRQGRLVKILMQSNLKPYDHK